MDVAGNGRIRVGDDVRGSGPPGLLERSEAFVGVFKKLQATACGLGDGEFEVGDFHTTWALDLDLASRAEHIVAMDVVNDRNIVVVVARLDLRPIVAERPVLMLVPSSHGGGIAVWQGFVERFHWVRGGRGTRTRRGIDRGLGSGIESDSRRSCR